MDIEDAEEEEMKESFTNEAEAQKIADYLKAYDLDMSDLAIMSPFRT